MRNGLIGYFCIILYDQWMILQAVNFSDLLCVVFGFRVRTSQKCIFFLFVHYFFFTIFYFKFCAEVIFFMINLCPGLQKFYCD